MTKRKITDNLIFEWDTRKDQINSKKHGLSLEEATAVFEDHFLIEIHDDENSSLEEDRYICLGSLKEFLIVVVAYADRNGIIRLISARKAESKEKEAYYESFKRKTGRNSTV